MSRKFLVSVSMLGLASGGLIYAVPEVAGQTFVGTPTPQQFARPGQALDRQRRMVHQRRRREIHALFAARPDQRRKFQQAGSGVALQDRRVRPLSRIQARRHADHGQGRALHDRGHAALGRRARRQDRRADLVAQPARRGAGGEFARASCRDAGSPTGPTAAATTASST